MFVFVCCQLMLQSTNWQLVKEGGRKKEMGNKRFACCPLPMVN
jgi:hypothetical protein